MLGSLINRLSMDNGVSRLQAARRDSICIYIYIYIKFHSWRQKSAQELAAGMKEPSRLGIETFVESKSHTFDDSIYRFSRDIAPGGNSPTRPSEDTEYPGTLRLC